MDNGTAIVEAIIQSYPELMQKVHSLKDSVSRSNNNDPTASAAMIELPAEDQRRYDAICSAIKHTARAYHDGSRRLLVIQASYWGSSNTNLLRTISWLDAQEYRMDFVQAVSQKLGLNDCTGCIYYRRLFGNNGTAVQACHYCYDTGMKRKHDDVRCYSKCMKNKVNAEVLA